jgi:hypothetical protein
MVDMLIYAGIAHAVLAKEPRIGDRRVEEYCTLCDQFRRLRYSEIVTDQ